MSDKNENEASKIQEDRASYIARRADEVVAGKGLDVYLKERWMLGYIKDIGCPFIYDLIVYKLFAIFIFSFISLFFIRSYGFLLMIVLVLGLFSWEFLDRLKSSKKLIREMGGHEKAATVLNIFTSSHYTEGMSPFFMKKLKDYTVSTIEVKARLDALDKAEKDNKSLKSNGGHKQQKSDLLERKSSLNKKQPLFMLLFCFHMYKSQISKIMSIS